MVSVLVLCVLVLFCLCFALLFVVSLPKLSQKNSLDVRSGVFWVVSLSSFGVFRRRRRPFVFVSFFF